MHRRIKKIRQWWKRNRNVPDTRAFVRGNDIYLGYDYVLEDGPMYEVILLGLEIVTIRRAVHRWGDDWRVISSPSSSAQ